MSDPSDPTWSPPARYVFYRKIAEGGTAVVALVWDTVDQEWRAIKTLQRDYAKRTALRNRFEREGHTMTTLDHPNVIRVYDAVADDEGAYLVMEYAEGGSIIDWLERHGPMPPRMAAEVALQLCRGIQAAHEQGIIHRDVKPQNLVIDRYGVVKVTDFGIAQATKEPRLTLTGTVMGTVGYMAPEQSESAKHADGRADIYSIAATLYTMVRGEAPTHLFMAEEDEYRGVPPVLAAIIQHGGEYRREARYGSVAEMADALEQALDELPLDPPTTPPLLPHNIELVDDLVPPLDGGGPPVPDSYGESLDRPVEWRPRNETPSSILPRDALGPPAQKRIARPLRRESVHRVLRRRRIVQTGIVSAVLAVLLYAGLAFVGQIQVDRARRRIEMSEQDLEKSVADHSTLPERLRRAPAPNAEVVAQLFERIPVEIDRNRRDGNVTRLIGVLDQTVRAMEASGAIGLEGTLGASQSALKSLQERSRRYTQFVTDCRDLESSVLPILARPIPKLGGRCLSETIERP